MKHNHFLITLLFTLILSTAIGQNRTNNFEISKSLDI